MADRISVGSVEDLVSFRAHLVDFNQQLHDSLQRVYHHWSEMGDVWADDKYREFGEALTEMAKGIDRYLEVTPDHEAHLQQLIDRLHAFLDTNLR